MTIHYIKHSEIFFSSLNPYQVEHYEKVLKDVSLEYIKEGKIEGRHRLLLNMQLAGHSPLSEEYMRVRGIVYEKSLDMEKRLKPRWNQTLSSLRQDIREKVCEKVYRETGWKIKP
jgi:hypothetical protein